MRYKIFIGWLAFMCLFISCNKDTIRQNDQYVGDSRISYFPEISTIGARLVILKQNDNFTDSGAMASVNSKPAEYTTDGKVDAATPGVYTLIYSTKNSDGFASSDFRTVVVIGNDVTANDFSGSYLRGSTGQTSVWTKLSNGVYKVDNPGGASIGQGFDVIAVNYSGLNIRIPLQLAFDPSLNGDNKISSSNEIYTLTPAPPTYKWVLSAGGYGTSLRTFVKQ